LIEILLIYGESYEVHYLDQMKLFLVFIGENVMILEKVVY
jgi:hypothetical protein